MRIIGLLILFSLTCFGQELFYNSTGKIDPLKLENRIKKIEISKQTIEFRIYTSTPTASDIEEGQIVLFLSDGAYRIYAKISGLIKYVDLK